MSGFVDTMYIEAVGVGQIDNLTSVQITNDLNAPSEGAFEMGNEGSWPAIAENVKHGTEYKVRAATKDHGAPPFTSATLHASCRSGVR